MNQAKNNFIYQLTDRIGLLDIFPLGESSFSINYSKEDNDSNFDYKKEMSGKMTLKDEAFSRLMSLESSVYRCDEQIIEIFKDCNGIQKLVFSGRISLNEAEFNLDKCFIVLKFMKDNKDQCFKDGKSKKINVMPLINNRVIVKTASPNGVLETKQCNKTGSFEIDLFYWCGTGEPEDGNWTCVSSISTSDDNIHHFNRSTWVREIISTDCLDEGEPEWKMIQVCDGTIRKFAKKVDIYDCKSGENRVDAEGYQFEYNCKILGYELNNATIDNGMKLEDVLNVLLSSTCPELTLKSEFFQINPDVVDSVNYVTNKTSNVNQIIVFQKSDAKRPNDSGNAWKLELSIDKVLEILFQMFNVKWRIIGNEFRLEHVSYFSKGIGFDVTSEALKKYFVGKRVYSYQSEKIPQKETFEFKEQGSEYWRTEVIYSGCVTNNSNNEVKNIVDGAMTDVLFALSNPQADNKNVTDEGFVLISTKKNGTDYLINSENTINGRRLNNVFSFPILFSNFHYYNRPMKSGKVDGVTTEFITTIPTKKGEKFAIPYSVCSEEFNPDDIIKTGLGNGLVESGSLRLKDCMIELELLYESNQDLVQNIPPNFVGAGVYQTYKNTPLLIDIVVGDVDGNVTSIQILRPATNGIVEVVSLSQIKYTPNLNSEGFDSFALRAVDNLSEFSTTANFGINILNENVAPVAFDDNFNVFQDEAFVQPFSILANDTDDYNSISIVTTSATTNEGVSVSIDSAGFFNYIPPVSFEGNDFFDYEIKDDLNNVSTARVNLNVTYKNKPIAVDDNYQSSKNTVFSTNGTIGRELLIANDYSADGVSYTFTTDAETKATVQGGSVTIGTDGSFSYTPPTDFVGIDSFTYTVNNTNGSATGNVSISVVPGIFVKLTTENLTTIGRREDTEFQKRQDYVLRFFSNVEGTVPIDVTPFNFKVKIKENEIQKINDVEQSNSNYSYFTANLDGIKKTILKDFFFYIKTDFGVYEEITETFITIEPSTIYQII